MREKHGSSIEKIGSGLVSSVETFRGCRLEFVKRTSGFNGLSTNKDGKVRKIEIKTMERSDYWIAISGLIAIDKLFFERDYWLYFVLLPENIVAMAKALSFLRKQFEMSSKLDFLQDLENWIKSTRRLSRKSGLKFIPRINIKFSIPVRKLVEMLMSGIYDREWEESIKEVWQNKGTWERIFYVEDEF